jgi:hypothetical protein
MRWPILICAMSYHARARQIEIQWALPNGACRGERRAVEERLAFHVLGLVKGDSGAGYLMHALVPTSP